MWRNPILSMLLLALCIGALALGGCSWLQSQPAVDFSLSPAEGSKPLLVDFVPSAEGEPTAYAWDFGDGAGSSEQVPSHVYYTAGLYSVTLTVSYSSGSVVSVRKEDCVEVHRSLSKEAELNLYWLDRTGKAIRRGALSGGMITTLVTNISNGLSLSAGLGRIYWIDGSSIYKAQLGEGYSATNLFYYYGTPKSVCVDAAGSKLYWTAVPDYYGSGGIMRSDPLGGSRESWAQVWHSGDAVPWFLAVDSASGRLYYLRMYYHYEPPHPRATEGVKSDPVSASIEWTDTATFSAHFVRGGLGRSGGMAVDSGLSAGARYVYWTDIEGGRIGRCKIDGTYWTWLIIGLASPKGIAVDILGGRLYWSDDAGIHRANLDGTGQELIYPGASADALAIG